MRCLDREGGHRGRAFIRPTTVRLDGADAHRAARDSKLTRLRSHITVILDGKIALPESAEWRQDYVAEFVEFPKSKFSDQVDATTQFLEFMATNPTLKTVERSGRGALALHSRPQPIKNLAGAAIAFGSRRFT